MTLTYAISDIFLMATQCIPILLLSTVSSIYLYLIMIKLKTLNTLIAETAI